jgi:hypothetical protein
MWPTGGRLIRMTVVALVLVSGAAGYLMFGLRLYGQYQNMYGNYQLDPASACGALITWTPPPAILTAFYVNSPQFLTIRYRSPHPEHIRLTVSIAGFTQEQSVDTESSPTFRTQSFKPPLSSPSILDALVGPGHRDAQILLRVQAGGKICDASRPVQLISRQIIEWQDASGKDESQYLAGWVTPNDPSISSLVGAAGSMLVQNPARYPDITSLYGYNGGNATAAQVTEQVNAIFDTLQFVYHVHYVNENIPYPPSGKEQVQLPKDLLASKPPAGMCVETSVLMASALSRIGLRPYIIIVPRHAFLGVALSANASGPQAYWETSDLNNGVRGDQANVHGDTEYNQYQTAGQILRDLDVTQLQQHGYGPIE